MLSIMILTPKAFYDCDYNICRNREIMQNLPFLLGNHWTVANRTICNVSKAYNEVCIVYLFHRTIWNARYLQAVRRIRRRKGEMGKRYFLPSWFPRDLIFPIRNQKLRVYLAATTGRGSQLGLQWSFNETAKAQFSFKSESLPTIERFFPEIVDSWLRWISFPIWTFESEK